MTTAPLQTVLANVTRTPEDIHQLSDDSIHKLLTTALGRIFQHIDLTFDEMYQVMLIIMQGKCSDAMMGAILTGLRMKGESIDEISASASAMRALAANITPKNCEYMVDIVGTGGDGANLFNVSTAGTPNLVIGVFTAQLCEPLAKVMKNLGARHVMVVGAKDGLDEISLATSTTVAELKDGEISVYEMMPEDAGIESQTLIGLDVDSPEQSLALIRAALSGVETHDRAVLKARDMIALNAGAAIYTAGLASNYPNGVNQAQTVIQNGSALIKLESLAQYTQQLAAQD